MAALQLSKAFGQQGESIFFHVLEDSLKIHTISTIQHDDVKFRKLNESRISFNVTNSAIWLKFKISSPQNSSRILFLELTSPTIHYLDYFYPADSGNYAKLSTGFMRDYFTRAVLSDHFIFPCKSDGSWYYLRLESGHFLNTEFKIGNFSTISLWETKRNLIFGLYGGIILVIIIIILFIISQTKQYHFLFYIGFLTFGSAIALLESGTLFANLWPRFPIFNYIFPIYTFGVSFFLLSFLRYAFKANQIAPYLFNFNFWFLTILPLPPTIYFLAINQYSKAIYIVQLSSSCIALLTLIMTFTCFYKTKEFKPYYRLFIVGQLCTVVSVLIYLSAQNQLISLDFFKDFVIMAGGIGEAICFTIAIFSYQSSLIKKYNGLLKKQNSLLQTAVELRTRELEFKNRDLVLAMQEKDSILNVVVHDLKSPLHQTKAIGKILAQNIKDENITREMLARIDEASDHGIKLIDELSTIAKLENHNDTVTLEKVSLSNLCQPLLKNIKLIAKQKEIRLETSIPPELEIITYPPYFIRILENLLSNAIKFSPWNSEINFSANETSVCIKDQGPGFSAEDLKNIFSKFKRLSARPTGGESSTGLGLYIVKLLADKLKLKIEVESKPAMGSTIRLKF